MQRTLLTGLALALLAVQACGSDDGKKSRNPGEAGMGGEAGAEPGAGGSSAGEPVVGSAGEPSGGGVGGVMTDGGMAGVPVVSGGAGGEPEPPEPELLFSVKPGAVGLEGTGVRSLSEQSLVGTAIYTSNSGAQQEVDGTNAVKLTGEALGLAPSTQIVSFAALQPEPVNPTFLFSLADGSEGGVPTRVYDSYWNSGDEEANVYFSDGLTSYRNLGEDGDQFGYNALLATETSLGLFPGSESNAVAGPVGPPDDLTGLVVRDARLPLEELYFTVDTYAEGAVDSAVSAVDAYDRGCTVFKSELDGTNTVAFTCAELGLASGDRIDGLASFSDGETTRVVFSVSYSSQGLLLSGVRDVVISSDEAGATLFESTGDGTNAVYVAASALGLGELVVDEIDALTVIDAPKPRVASAGSCSLDPDPFTLAEGGIDYFGGTAQLGSNIMLVYGGVSEGARAFAYNASTCAFLQQKDLPYGFEETRFFALVPLAGWSAATPLDDLEYLVMGVNNDVTQQEVRRYDAEGVFQSAAAVTGTDYDEDVDGLVYDKSHDRLFAFLRYYSYSRPYLRMLVMPRPGAASTVLEPFGRDLTTPCADHVSISGTDPLGNVFLARRGLLDELRVCAFGPEGELRPSPYWWTSESGGDTGFIVPGGSHYLFNVGGGASIERSTPQ